MSALAALAPARSRARRNGKLLPGQTLRKDFARNKYKYLIFLPVLIYLILFCYKPMYGVLLAFKNYRPGLGITKSPWYHNPLTGELDLCYWFRKFFQDPYCFRVIRNTIVISFYSIVVGFPIPILFALLLNEVRSSGFKRTVQTITYVPHFLSIVILCGMLVQFCSLNGMFNIIRGWFGLDAVSMLNNTRYFRGIYVWSGVWQNFGWDSIIYLAALAGVDQEQYEAARIDGAGRLRQCWSITLPGILPTIVMMFILRMGSVMGVGYEKVMLLYNERTYEVADVISTYVYRVGMVQSQYAYSTAINLFNSLVNILFLVSANKLSKKVSDIGLF